MGIVQTTAENLKDAASAKTMSGQRCIKSSPQLPAEGFDTIADVFQEIAEVEEEHEKRYRRLLARVEDGTVFTRDEPIKWRCRNCGYVHIGKEAPAVCPACDHPRAHYEELAENY